MSIGEDIEEETLDRELRSKYGHALSDFELSLRNIKAFYDFLSLKKRKLEYREKIKDLLSNKKKLIKHVDNFLSETNLWDEIKKGRNLVTFWTPDRVATYIESKFGLKYFFKKLDERISSYEKSIMLLDGFRMEVEKNKKTINRRTLASLVWFYLMNAGNVTNTEKFRDIRRIFNWLSKNKPETMKEIFGSKIVFLDDPAIKASYDRYIKSPTIKRKAYRDLAFEIVAETLSPVE